MVLGLDSCTDPDKVYKAYNDSKGITRQFYENGLYHANTVLGYEAFKPSDWDVVTDYDPVGGRHQAFYVPNRDVTINGVLLPKGEKLLFEDAYKYDATQCQQLWHDAGLIQGAEFGNDSGEYRMCTPKSP